MTLATGLGGVSCGATVVQGFNVSVSGCGLISKFTMVTITLSGVNNPGSTKPSSNFKIYSMDSFGYSIDSVTSGGGFI